MAVFNFVLLFLNFIFIFESADASGHLSEAISDGTTYGKKIDYIVEGEKVSTIHFTIADGVCNIGHIDTHDGHEGKGYATTSSYSLKLCSTIRHTQVYTSSSGRLIS
uniref:Uncharacterized protein n=1 Tax=Ditylenchus dipsaci TaxID=166011 RepID=A0A915DKE6_9BILA